MPVATQILDWLVLHKFNSIRVPFSLLFALSPANTTCPKGFVSKDLEALTSWEILDMLFERTAQRGILILLDMHQVCVKFCHTMVMMAVLDG